MKEEQTAPKMSFSKRYESDNKTTTAVFVMSSWHSGSTWVGYVLGSAANAAFVGEYYRAWNEELRVPCTICAARGLSACEVLHDAETTPWQDAFRFAAERTRRQVIVENSKSLDWTRRFLGRPDISVFCVLVVKDPRSWFASLRRRSPQDLEGALERWCDENLSYRDFLAENPDSAVTVAYDLLTASPRSEFAALFAECGLRYSDDALAYWTREHHGFAANGASDALLRSDSAVAPPAHFKTGDDSFYGKHSRSLFRDERWRSELTEAENVSIREHPRVVETLGSLGYRLTEHGLERAIRRSGQGWWRAVRSRIVGSR